MDFRYLEDYIEDVEEEAYDILLKVKDMADILIPLHEPGFASVNTIPSGAWL